MNSSSSVAASPRFTWLSVVPAATVALWNIFSAPFLTKLVVEPFKEAVGIDRFVVVLGLFVGLVGVAVVIAGFSHLREARRFRVGLIGIGLGLVVAYVVLSDRGKPSEAVVEQLHFVSYGSLAALLVVPLRRLRRLLPVGVFLVVLMVALLDEGLQWFVPVRTGEFFDVSLNMYAALCGQLVGLGLFSVGFFSAPDLRVGWRPEVARAVGGWPGRKSGARILAPLLVASVLLVAIFIQWVHLGYQIHSPAVGSFRSFFSEQELVERNRRTTATWAVRPPGPLTPFEKEDWFRTEAGWHVLARNRANSREDWVTAYGENLIAEKYYGAFLATPDRKGRSRRLDPVHTANLERLAGAGESAPLFVSHADNGRIWLQPRRAVLWSLALLTITALGLWGKRA